MNSRIISQPLNHANHKHRVAFIHDSDPPFTPSGFACELGQKARAMKEAWPPSTRPKTPVDDNYKLGDGAFACSTRSPRHHGHRVKYITASSAANLRVRRRGVVPNLNFMRMVSSKKKKTRKLKS